jgi:hypothetical protein
VHLSEATPTPGLEDPASLEIVMLSTPEISHYAWLGEASWTNYAKRHGYSFVVCRDKLVPAMHINWSKIELVKRRLANTDATYLLLVDADSVVIDPGLKALPLLPAGKRIVFSVDQPFPYPGRINIGRRHLLRLLLRQRKLPNAGFMLMQVGDYSQDFFGRWLDLARTSLSEWADIHPRNQNVLWRSLLNSERHHIAILDKQVVRLTHPGQIRHVARLNPFVAHFKHEIVSPDDLLDIVPDRVAPVDRAAYRPAAQ